MSHDVLTWSCGGGRQSTAIAVLVAQGRLPKPDLIGIADTGREASETWEYMDAVLRPLLASVGLTIEIIPHSFATVDLYSHKGDLLLPAYTADSRLDIFCSSKWKQMVFQRWLRREKRIQSCTTWLGMSLDEIGRLKDSRLQWQRLHYPLVFDVPLRAHECVDLVKSFGLPEPPHSSCWMCPHRQNPQWSRLRDHYPADWEAACQLDEAIRARDTQDGVYLHKSRVPLRDADLSTPPAPKLPLFGEVDGCDGGYCWT